MQPFHFGKAWIAVKVNTFIISWNFYLNPSDQTRPLKTPVTSIALSLSKGIPKDPCPSVSKYHWQNVIGLLKSKIPERNKESMNLHPLVAGYKELLLNLLFTRNFCYLKWMCMRHIEILGFSLLSSIAPFWLFRYAGDSNHAAKVFNFYEFRKLLFH